MTLLTSAAVNKYCWNERSIYSGISFLTPCVRKCKVYRVDIYARAKTEDVAFNLLNTHQQINQYKQNDRKIRN
jgi:hypothetical protein